MIFTAQLLQGNTKFSQIYLWNALVNSEFFLNTQVSVYAHLFWFPIFQTKINIIDKTPTSN